MPGPFHFGFGKVRFQGRVSQAATDLTHPVHGCPNAIMIESAGSVTFTSAEDSGTSHTMGALAVGVWHPVRHFLALTACPANTNYAIIE
jgi:hypothetical protein